MTMLMMICWFSKSLAMTVVCCDNDGADDNNNNNNFIACFCIACLFPPVTVSKLTSHIATPSSRNA